MTEIKHGNCLFGWEAKMPLPIGKGTLSSFFAPQQQLPATRYPQASPLPPARLSFLFLSPSSFLPPSLSSSTSLSSSSSSSSSAALLPTARNCFIVNQAYARENSTRNKHSLPAGRPSLSLLFAMSSASFTQFRFPGTNDDAATDQKKATKLY